MDKTKTTESGNQGKGSAKKLKQPRRQTGTVVFYNYAVGYGIIRPSNTLSTEVHVYNKDFILKEGTKLKDSVIMKRLLEFDVVVNEDEIMEAKKVTECGGEPISDPHSEMD